MDGDVAELDCCKLLFPSRPPFSAITSIMAIQQAKQASMHGLALF